MKGQLYSLIALMVAIPIFLFLAYYMTSAQAPSDAAMRKVVSDQVHEMERGMEDDFSRAVNIAARRAMLTLLMEMTDTGAYESNASSILMELIINGSMEGDDTPMMSGNTLPEWHSRLLSVRTGFTKSFSYELLSVNRSEGFNLLAEVHVIANVSADGIRIDREFDDVIQIPLADIEDPIYSVETGGMMTKSISPYQYPYFVQKIASGTVNSTCFGNVTFDSGSPNANLILITNDSTGMSGYAGIVSATGTPSQNCYMTGVAGAVALVSQAVSNVGYGGLLIDSPTSGLWSVPFRQGLENGNHFNNYGVDMIDRLEGNLVSGDGGFISFVNTDDLELTGTPIKENQTRTDYLYFSDEIVNGKVVRGMPDWFRIDDATATRFNLSSLVNS